MARIDFDLQKYDGEFKKAGMARLHKAAEAIRDEAKKAVKIGKITRVPGRHRFVNADGHLVESTNPPYWMERNPGAMRETIRVVRRREGEATIGDTGQVDWDVKDDNVRVYAGNRKTWWAVQMEYGHGAWKGGPNPFMRPAMRQSEGRIRTIIEGGS